MSYVRTLGHSVHNRHRIQNERLRFQGSRIGTLAVCLIGLCSTAWSQEYKQAYEETKAEYNAVAKSVTETQTQINEMNEGLSKAMKYLKVIPAGPERDRVEMLIKDAKQNLRLRSKQMGKFNTYASKMTDGFELISEISALRETANSRAGGPLAAQMTYVAAALTKYGEDVPILGKALKAYGDATTAMLNATDKFAKKVDTERNQEMIGQGTYNFLFNAKYKAMKAQFGADVADGDTYAPEGVRCVFRSVNDHGKAFIWDEQAGEWYKVSNPKANLEQVYRESLLIGKPKTPFELKVLADKWAEVQARREEADALYEKLYKDRYSSLAFMNVDDSSDRALSKLIGNKEMFRAYFTYDQQGRQKIDQLISDLKTETKRLKDEDKKAEAQQRKLEAQERLKEREAFLAKQRDEYEETHAKKLTEPETREVKSLHRRIAEGMDAIGRCQTNINAIVNDSQSCVNAIHEEIRKVEAILTAQMLNAAEFQTKAAKIMAETENEDTRKAFEKHLKDCREALADQTFCVAHAGGYYDWGTIAYDDLAAHHFGRSVKGNRYLIAKYRKAIQTAIGGAKSGKLHGIDRSWTVQVSGSYYYPYSINEWKQDIEVSREAIKAHRKALEAFERINTDPEPVWEMPLITDPGKVAADNEDAAP